MANFASKQLYQLPTGNYVFVWNVRPEPDGERGSIIIEFSSIATYYYILLIGDIPADKTDIHWAGWMSEDRFDTFCPNATLINPDTLCK